MVSQIQTPHTTTAFSGFGLVIILILNGQKYMVWIILNNHWKTVLTGHMNNIYHELANPLSHMRTAQFCQTIRTALYI